MFIVRYTNNTGILILVTQRPFCYSFKRILNKNITVMSLHSIGVLYKQIITERLYDESVYL